MHSVERIYLRKRCFNASKPCVAASTGSQYQYVVYSRRNKIPHCSAYGMGESNLVAASGLWSRSGSKVDQFVHVPTPADMQNVIEIHACFFLVTLLTDRQTDKHRGQSNLPSPLSEAYDTCSCSLFVLFTQADCSCWQIFSQISHSNLKSFQKKDYFNLLRSQTLNSHFYCAMLCIVRSVLSPGVCLSVCLSHAGIMSKRLSISSHFSPLYSVFP